jgi:hypothetical protein
MSNISREHTKRGKSNRVVTMIARMVCPMEACKPRMWTTCLTFDRYYKISSFTKFRCLRSSDVKNSINPVFLRPILSDFRTVVQVNDGGMLATRTCEDHLNFLMVCRLIQKSLSGA